VTHMTENLFTLQASVMAIMTPDVGASRVSAWCRSHADSRSTLSASTHLHRLVHARCLEISQVTGVFLLTTTQDAHICLHG